MLHVYKETEYLIDFSVNINLFLCVLLLFAALLNGSCMQSRGEILMLERFLKHLAEGMRGGGGGGGGGEEEGEEGENQQAIRSLIWSPY